jgi:hypothetical protein
MAFNDKQGMTVKPYKQQILMVDAWLPYQHSLESINLQIQSLSFKDVLSLLLYTEQDSNYDLIIFR